jgi:hypothetical protein
LLESPGGDGASILGHDLANFFAERLDVFRRNRESVKALASR